MKRYSLLVGVGLLLMGSLALLVRSRSSADSMSGSPIHSSESQVHDVDEHVSSPDSSQPEGPYSALPEQAGPIQAEADNPGTNSPSSELSDSFSVEDAVTRLVSGTDPDDVAQAKRQLTTGTPPIRLFDALLAGYAASESETGRGRVVSVTRELQDTTSLAAMSAFVMENHSSFNDPLAVAVVETLAKSGLSMSANALIARLDLAQDESEAATLFWSIAQIQGYDARAVLINVALGNKGPHSPIARIATIYAMGNYPDQEASDVLAHLAMNTDPGVRDAATLAQNVITGKPRPD